MIDYSIRDVLWSRDLFKFWQITDSILEMVQYRDMVTVGD